MGHLINPITYRVGKTKFWSFTWANVTKKNYKKFLIEDLNFRKYIKWLFFILQWEKVGIFLHDFKLIKNFNNIDVSLFFFMKKLKLSGSYKKSYFNFFVKNSFVNFFFKFLFYKKSIKHLSLFKKQPKKNLNIKLIKHKRLKRSKIKKILKTFNKHNFILKKKKKRLKKAWLTGFLFKYCFFSFKNQKEYKKKYLKILNYFFLPKTINIRSFVENTYLKKLQLLQKNQICRTFNYSFFFRILSFFLTFFLKKVFLHSKFLFNFFQKTNRLSNSESIKKFIRFTIKSNNRNKVSQTVKKVFRKLRKKYQILGIKIGFFGRYEKKLRNKKVWQIRGSLSPSNINTPITYKSFCILLKQGLCGVKISFLNKIKKNEIFKKKTFTNKTFKFI